MKKYIISFFGNLKELAKYEFLNLINVFYNKKIELKELNPLNNYFIFQINEDFNENFLRRLTYVDEIFEILFEGNNYENYNNELEKINLNFLKDKNISFKILKVSKDNKLLNYNLINYDYYLDKVWTKLKDVKVDLKNYDEKILIFNNHDYFLFSKQIFQNKRDFLKRMPKFRKVNKPYTLKSDISSLMVNFLNVKKGIVLDPFCGVGGLILEIFDKGFVAFGNDINFLDLCGTYTNLIHFWSLNELNPKIKLFNKDINEDFFIRKEILDGIVTDVPYGKLSRKISNDKNIYINFLKHANYYLKPKKRVVVLYSNEIKDIEENYTKFNFKKVNSFEIYYNKNLSRKLLILEKIN